MYLFAAVFLPLVGICMAQSELCDPKAKQRIDCGYHGISEGQCTVDRQCCWHTGLTEMPWCFYDGAETCFPYNMPKIDCGYYGIDEEECVEKRGCCWHPTDEANAPWCFTRGSIVACSDVTPSSRVDCGYYGIKQDECERKGCCWDDSVKNVPWCFYNLELSPPPEE